MGCRSEIRKNISRIRSRGSVVDPWQFGTNPDPGYLWLTDPALDPAIYVNDIEDDNKNFSFFSCFGPESVQFQFSCLLQVPYLHLIIRTNPGECIFFSKKYVKE